MLKKSLIQHSKINKILCIKKQTAKCDLLFVIQLHQNGNSKIINIIKSVLLCRTLFVMPALRIFPGRHQPSIVRMKLLNYRVRNGNGWDQLIINTDYYGTHIIVHTIE